MPPLNPPHWTAEQLDRERQTAVDAFVEALGTEGTLTYVNLFAELEPVVRRLFDSTSDLSEFGDSLFSEDGQLIDAARFLASPHISEANLRTLLEATTGTANPRRCSADSVLRVMRQMWDPIRLPWLREKRAATPIEREAAIKWTTGVWAVQRVGTSRRIEPSRVQEEKVALALLDAGYLQEDSRQRIDDLDELPRGSFCRETGLAGPKCDIPVRLHDGRLLALECKVSNSALNSVKRLLRETGGKALAWRTSFGRRVVTGAVLAGVYKLGDLLKAQTEDEVAIFWEHDLAPLKAFVSQSE